MSTENNIENENATKSSAKTKKTTKPQGPKWWRVLKGLFFTGVMTGIIGAFALAIYVAMVWPSLPSIESLKDYKPRMAMQVFTEDGQLIGEFGEERRKMIEIKDVPDHVK